MRLSDYCKAGPHRPGNSCFRFPAAGVLLFVFILFVAAGCSTAQGHSPRDNNHDTSPLVKRGEEVMVAGNNAHHPAKTKPYKVLGRWYRPVSDSSGFSQEGTASWYGSKFHGRKTANGETYNMYAMTAAHKTLPLGTRVKVKNLKNGREATVRVNDRGPFVRGRIIDLSKKAAGKLGVLGPGTAPVKIWAVGSLSKNNAPVDYTRGNFTVQVAAYKNYDNAVRLREKLAGTYGFAQITTYQNGSSTFYRVRVGRYGSLALAKKFEKILSRNGYAQAFMIAE